jgi:MFS family permease
MMGSWAYTVTAVVVVFNLTSSATQVGLVTVVQFSVPLVLAPVGGALADRFDRRKLLLCAQASSSMATGVLALANYSGGPGGIRQVWPIFVASFVLGLGSSLADPARHALVPALIPPEEMAPALSLNSVTFNIGRTVGPALAGALLASTGAGGAFTFTAVTYGVFAAVLLVLRPRPTGRQAEDDGKLGAGLKYLRADRRKLALLCGVAVAGFASDPVITLSPLLAQDLPTSSEFFAQASTDVAVAAMASSYGCGAILTIVALRALHYRFGYRMVGLAGLALSGAITAALALAPTLEVACVLLVAGGAGYFLAVSSLTALLQMVIPEHLRGRVMAVWGMFFLGSRPVAALTDSTLARLLSARWALLLVAALVALASYWVAKATQELPSEPL